MSKAMSLLSKSSCSCTYYLCSMICSDQDNDKDKDKDNDKDKDSDSDKDKDKDNDKEKKHLENTFKEGSLRLVTILQICDI